MRRRTLVIALVAACAHAPAAPMRRPTLAVVGLEPVGPVDVAAHQLTERLRFEAASDHSRFVLAPHTDRDLVELKELASCKNDAPSCMAAIGAYLEVDYMLYGKLVGNTLSLDLMDVAKRFNRRAIRVTISADRRATARAAFEQLGGTR